MQKNKVFGVILASGLSKRMGKNKLLLKLSGITIFEHTLNACLNSNLSGIVVVTSYPKAVEICVEKSVNCIENHNSHIGLSQSVILGTKYFYDEESIMFISADTPFLSTDTINSLISNFSNDILVPYFKNTPQNPVIFPKYTFDDLLTLTGDQGGKKIFSKYSHEKLEILQKNTDIDTYDDYKNAIKRF